MVLVLVAVLLVVLMEFPSRLLILYWRWCGSCAGGSDADSVLGSVAMSLVLGLLFWFSDSNSLGAILLIGFGLDSFSFWQSIEL